MSFETLLTRLEAGVFTITINRPEKMNALNRQVFDDLNRVLDEVYANNAIRSVLITGSGSKAFVAGADISEFNDLDATAARELARRGQDTFFRIENCTKPIVAAVNGFALGGGCELAMSCHFRVAAPNARFGQPEVNLGLIPGYGGTQRLAQLIGKGRALELLLTGNMLDAEAAYRMGLVNHIFSAETLHTEAVQLLQIINSKAPLAVAGCIRALHAGVTGGNGFAAEVEEFGNTFNTADRIEGTTAFLEKRKPVFKGI